MFPLRNAVSVVLVLALTLAFAITARAELPAGWDTDLTNAVRDAQRFQKPLLVYFTASWCGPCKLMARTTLTNDTVRDALSRVGHVALDIDEHRDLAAQFGVSAVPTFQMLSCGGDPVERLTGYRPAPEFVEWLTNSVAAARAAFVRLNQFRETLNAVDQLIMLGDRESNRKAAADLADLSVERDATISRSAATRLRTLVGRDPEALLDELDHPRLAARIQVANALRTQIGDDFDVDPWADAATRESAIARWREKLAVATPETPASPSR